MPQNRLLRTFSRLRIWYFGFSYRFIPGFRRRTRLNPEPENVPVRFAVVARNGRVNSLTRGIDLRRFRFILRLLHRKPFGGSPSRVPNKLIVRP